MVFNNQLLYTNYFIHNYNNNLFDLRNLIINKIQ